MPILRASRAPNLTNAPQQYIAEHLNQLYRELRTYFNTLDNGLSALYGPLGGSYLTFSYGAFYDTTEQTASSITTAYVIRINSTSMSEGITIEDGQKITFAEAGVYDIQFSIQLINESNATQDVDIWFRQNGTDIPDSNSRFGIGPRQSEGDFTHVIASLNFYANVAATDYIELVWWTSSTEVKLETYSGLTSPTRPDIPSVIITATRVSDVTSDIYG
jgi:hypothetical protein